MEDILLTECMTAHDLCCFGLIAPFSYVTNVLGCLFFSSMSGNIFFVHLHCLNDNDK